MGDGSDLAARVRRASHDLRGPLDVLLLRAARLLAQPGLDVSVRDDVAKIVTQGERLAQVIAEQVDALARVDVGATVVAAEVATGAAPAPPPGPRVAPEPSPDGAPPGAARPGATRVLLVEDSAPQAADFQRELAAASPGEFAVAHAATLADARRHLAGGNVDMVVLDLVLPDSQGMETVDGVREVAPDVPVVVLSGEGDRRMALEAVRRGAQDFLVKARADGEALSRSLHYARERARLVRELEEALSTVRKLSGILPVCASCKRIRDEQGGWQPMETYIHAHSEADFSHTYCETCARRLFPDLV